jgi:hypothetical protein
MLIVKNAECHLVECHYNECHYALFVCFVFVPSVISSIFRSNLFYYYKVVKPCKRDTSLRNCRESESRKKFFFN